MSEVVPRHLAPDGTNRSSRAHRAGAIAFGVVLAIVVLGVGWFTVAVLSAFKGPPPPVPNAGFPASPSSDEHGLAPGTVPQPGSPSSSSASSTTASSVAGGAAGFAATLDGTSTTDDVDAPSTSATTVRGQGGPPVSVPGATTTTARSTTTTTTTVPGPSPSSPPPTRPTR
jgi:cytoskeletal protein RodZ